MKDKKSGLLDTFMDTRLKCHMLSQEGRQDKHEILRDEESVVSCVILYD